MMEELNITKQYKAETIKLVLYCFFISLVFLLLCTKSSPLYPFNDWYDSNAFFTMGKGMVHGKVLYLDLFEQKGPLLYLLHAVGYLISNTSFTGVFIIEVIFFSGFLYYAFKTMMLFINRNWSYALLPVLAFVVLNMYAFSHGDSAEELCLPLLMISLYYLLKYCKEQYPKQMSNLTVFLNGFIAGCVLLIKFTFLFFWFGWILMVLIASILHKKYRQAILQALIFLAGIITAALPWLIYFIINHALDAFMSSYFIINITSYTNDLTLFERIVYIIKSLAHGFIDNYIFSVLFAIGIPAFVLMKKLNIQAFAKISLLVPLFLLMLGIYSGGVGIGFEYYFLIFAPFAVFGLIALGYYFQNKGSIPFEKIKPAFLAACLMLVLIPVTYIFNHNTYMLKWKKSDLVQYKFAEIINETPDATLLNYGGLDFGFFTPTNITPNIRFFEKQNIPYERFPQNVDEQNKYIKEKAIDYIVIRLDMNEDINTVNIPFLKDNYTLVSIQKQKYEDDEEFEYALFKLKDLNKLS